MTPPAVTSQTVGPFFSIGLNLLCVSDMAPDGTLGERFTLSGRVLDAGRNPVPDAVIEIWQADSLGSYSHRGAFRGFGRAGTDSNGAFHFASIKPGCVPGPLGTTQAPHLAVTIFMRGLLLHLFTRVYFPGEPLNASDPILSLVPAARRHTLIAAQEADGSLRWDILLQGEDETAFFDV